MTTGTRITAAGFAIGGAVHATAGALLARGIALYGPGYPAWRHVVMAVIDGSIAWIAVRRPGWLVVVLLAFVAEQLAVNGIGLTPIFALTAAGWVAWDGRAASTPETAGQVTIAESSRFPPSPTSKPPLSG